MSLDNEKNPRGKLLFFKTWLKGEIVILQDLEGKKR